MERSRDRIAGLLAAGPSLRLADMRITRAPRKNRFSIIPNAALEDERLSFRARGLLAFLLSRPDGWATDSVALSTGAAEGRDAVRSALGELETAGYLVREKLQGPDGRWSTDVTLFDEPATGAWKSVSGATWDDGVKPQVAPAPGKPAVGAPGAKGFKTDNKRGLIVVRRETADGAAAGCADHGDRRRPACVDCQRVQPLQRAQVRPASPASVAAARAAIRPARDAQRDQAAG